MCTGLEIAALASAGLGAAGTIHQGVTAQKSATAQADASNQVLNSFMDRNDKRAAEAEAVFADRMREARPDQQQDVQQQAVDQRQSAIGDALSKLDTFEVALPANAPRVVTDAIESESARAKGDSKARTDAGAQLAGFTDRLFQSGLATNRTARELGDIGAATESDASTLGYEQELAAFQAAKGPSVLGSALTGIGTIGAAGFGAAAGNAAGTAAAANTNKPFVYTPLRQRANGIRGV